MKRCEVTVWIDNWSSRPCGKPAKWLVSGTGARDPEYMCGVHARYYRKHIARGYRCEPLAPVPA